MAKLDGQNNLKTKIKELEEQLSTSNQAYMDLMRRYNELNQEKGDISGYIQLKAENERILLMYESVKNSLEHEKKMHKRTIEQFTQLQKKYDSIKNNSINDTKKAKGRPVKEIISADEIKERMNNGETAEQIANELGVGRATIFRRLHGKTK